MERTGRSALTRQQLIGVATAQVPTVFDGGAGGHGGAFVDETAVMLSAPRLPHQRARTELLTLAPFLEEERKILDLAVALDERAGLRVRPGHVKDLSADQAAAVRAIAESRQLVCPLEAPAGAGKTTGMRGLRRVVNAHGRRLIALAPTGGAVDVAVREGAADEGYTVDKVLADLAAARDRSLSAAKREALFRFRSGDVVVVDEANMVGADHYRQLLEATAAARVKVVLVGHAYQLQAVRARGGVFAMLCEDLPWTQKLSQVWRMKDPAERAASVALGEGGPAPRRRAVAWYAEQGRLHCGDEVAMSGDAVQAWREDIAAGLDALLIADRTKVCDGLNKRIHDERVAADAVTVGVARGQRVGEGDLIITRNNDARIRVDDATTLETPGPVRNGNRWAVTAVDAKHGQVVARRLSDNARAWFKGDYLTQHVALGYAVTVHSAEGVTCDTTHAVLSQDASRNLLYVALSRGRQRNEAYVYERSDQGNDHQQQGESGVHVLRRGDRREAMEAVAAIAANRDDRPLTAHQVAAQCQDRSLLPERAAELVARRETEVAQRRWRWLGGQRRRAEDVAAELVAARRVERMEEAERAWRLAAQQEQRFGRRERDHSGGLEL